jgi:hypothetical protein
VEESKKQAERDSMGDIVKFKPKKAVSEKEAEMLFFFKQLDSLKQLYVTGAIDKIIILADGQNKCCTSNKIKTSTAKQICKDFIENTKDYTG